MSDDLRTQKDHDLLIIAITEIREINRRLEQHLDNHRWFSRKVLGGGLALAILASWNQVVHFFAKLFS